MLKACMKILVDVLAFVMFSPCFADGRRAVKFIAAMKGQLIETWLLGTMNMRATFSTCFETVRYFEMKRLLKSKDLSVSKAHGFSKQLSLNIKEDFSLQSMFCFLFINLSLTSLHFLDWLPIICSKSEVVSTRSCRPVLKPEPVIPWSVFGGSLGQ